MAVNLSPVGGAAAQFFDNNGIPLSGGLLYTYAAGTSTPLVTYTTQQQTVANSNPIVLDSAGRVPNEIWLQSTFAYKFVLTNALGAQVWSYDNLVGINSNFTAYALQEQTFTATQGQTVFTLTGGIQYVPSTNNLSVFVNGSKQIVSTNYIETSSTIVTFTSGLNVGDVVDFITAISTSTSATSAANISYNEGGTGAVTTNVQAKLQQTVSVKDFGAVGDGTTDDTAAIQAAINASSINGAILYFPAGTYKVSSTSLNALTGLSNVKLQGVKGATTIFLTSTSTTTAIIGSQSAVFNFEIDGIIFDGNIASIPFTGVYCVKFDNIAGFQATNCVFQNSTLDGILLGTTLAKQILVENCVFQTIGIAGTGANGIRVYNNEGIQINRNYFYGFIISPIDTNPSTLYDNLSNTVITNNFIQNATSGWKSGISVISLLGDRFLVQGNTIINGGSGGQIMVHAYPSGRSVRDYKIIGNSLFNSTGTGIVVNQDQNTDVIVTNNNIKNCVGSGILVTNINTPPYSSTTPVIISDNIIEDSSSATYVNTNQPSCIQIAQAENVIISDNYCVTPRWAGISIQSGSNNIFAQDNTIIGQQGIAPTDLSTNAGGGIVVSPGGYSYSGNVTNVLINGNFIYNYLTSQSPTTNIRTGGIVVYNDSSGANTVDNITITNNMVRFGNGIGIQTYFLGVSKIDGNTISQTNGGTIVDTSSIGLAVNSTNGFYTAAPTTGTWTTGTVIYNSTPSSAGYVGWVCTAAGTPGTWKTFGLIT